MMTGSDSKQKRDHSERQSHRQDNEPAGQGVIPRGRVTGRSLLRRESVDLGAKTAVFVLEAGDALQRRSLRIAKESLGILHPVESLPPRAGIATRADGSS